MSLNELRQKGEALILRWPMTECHGGNSRTHYAIKNDMTGSNKIPRFFAGIFSPLRSYGLSNMSYNLKGMVWSEAKKKKKKKNLLEWKLFKQEVWSVSQQLSNKWIQAKLPLTLKHQHYNH